MKKGFIQQFDKSQPRVKNINRRLMNIRQNIEKNETIQSMSIRITQLFNEFKQMTGKSLLNSEKVDYFIDAVFPNYREQLNNQYQQEDGSYNQCSFEDVVATALKLERNAKAYEQDMQRMTKDAVKLTINAVHKPMNPKSHVTEKSCRKLSEVPRRDIVEEASENERQNTEDIKQIQKEQVIIKDQLAAVTNALQLQDLGEQMRGIRASVENLRYERRDCAGTANLMYGHRFKGTYNNDSTKNQYTKRYEDPRLYNAGRANDGQLQGNCFKCGRKGHYAIACRVQMYNKTGSSQVVQNLETVNGNHSQQIEMQQQNLDQQPQDVRSNTPNTSATESRLHSAERNEERSGAITRSMKQRSGANHVSVINLTNQHNMSDDGVRCGLLKLKGQIGKTQLKDIVFDSGAAISCLNAKVFNCLDSSIKSTLKRCSKDMQLTNATGGAMTMTLLGELKITIELEGRLPGEMVTFTDVGVMVVDNLQSEMLFGTNALTSDKFKSYKVNLDKSYIEFEDRFGSATQVPYNNTSDAELRKMPIPVYLSTNTRIPASSSIIVQGKSGGSSFDMITVEKDKHFVFTGTEEIFSAFVYVEDTLVSKSSTDEVSVIMTNLGDKPYTVKKGTFIGTCQIADDKVLELTNATQLQEKLTQINIGTINNVECQSIMPNKAESRVKDIEEYDFASIASIDDKKKKQLKSLLMDYAHVFEERSFGSAAIGLMEHSIELTDVNVKPIKHYGYRVAPVVAAELQKNVNDMQKLGVIEESQSPWASLESSVVSFEERWIIQICD